MTRRRSASAEFRQFRQEARPQHVGPSKTGRGVEAVAAAPRFMDTRPSLDDLTPRQRGVAGLNGEGYSNPVPCGRLKPVRQLMKRSIPDDVIDELPRRECRIERDVDCAHTKNVER